MPDVRDVPPVLRRGRQALVQRVHHATAGLAQAVTDSRERAYNIDSAFLVDKTIDVVSRSLEDQRRLAKMLLASPASQLMAEQRAYQRRVLQRTRSLGARLSAARTSTARQTRLHGAVQTASTGVKVAAEVLRENTVDARETVARQQSIANTTARLNMETMRALVGLSRLSQPLASVPAPADLGTTQAEPVAVNIELWKKPALVSEARSRGLATSGTVRDLRARLSGPHS